MGDTKDLHPGSNYQQITPTFLLLVKPIIYENDDRLPANLYPLYLMGTSQVSGLFTDTAFPYFFQLQDLLLIHSTPSIIQLKQKTIKKVK